MTDFTHISVQQAHELMETSKVTIADIRDPNAFAQGHIDQAQSVSDANIDAFLQNTDKAMPLICYCYHGISSLRAASFFTQQGFQKVYSIDGGWEEWKNIYG